MFGKSLTKEVDWIGVERNGTEWRIFCFGFVSLCFKLFPDSAAAAS